MDTSIIISLFLIIIGILIYLLLTIKNKENSDKGGSENLQNRLNEVSNHIIQLKQSVSSEMGAISATSIELNRFLGGSTKAGQLGEWSLESIVKDIVPQEKYKFQHQINPESRDLVDCSVTTSEGLLIPIDSKFYQGLFDKYETASKNEKEGCLKKFRDQTLKDAKDISAKYIFKDKTTNYAVLYMPSEKLVSLVDKIDGFREECLRVHKVLIVGPNTLTMLLDIVRIGHTFIKLNENADKISKVIFVIEDEFKKFDKSTEGVIKKLNSAMNDVNELQTRINVLGRELKKGVDIAEGIDKQ